MNLRTEPGDHAIGRSRGGLSTKIHHAVDGKGRPLAVLIGPGQGGDAPMCLRVLNAIRVPRLGPGRPRTRPDAVLADKAYSSRSIRGELRRRGGHPRAERPARQPQAPRGPRWATGRLRSRPLQGPQRRRTRLLPAQAVARTRHPLRQARHHLPRRRHPGRHPHLAAHIARLRVADVPLPPTASHHEVGDRTAGDRPRKCEAEGEPLAAGHHIPEHRVALGRQRVDPRCRKQQEKDQDPDGYSAENRHPDTATSCYPSAWVHRIPPPR